MATAAEQRESSFPVILEFVPTSSSMHIQEDSDNSVAPSIAMSLKLSGRDSVRTPADRLLNEMEWSVSLFCGVVTNEHVKSLGAIGMLNYYPASDDIEWPNPEGCSLWAHLKPESFAYLRELALTGRLPSVLRVHAKGMKYGWEPDGSGKVWDVETDKNIPIHQVEVSFVLSGPDDEDEELEPVENARRPVAASDLESLQRELVAATTGPMAQVRSRLGWTVALLGVLCIIIFFQ